MLSDLMVNLMDESRSDESDVYSLPASTVLNSSSGSDGDDIASENDLEEEFEPQVLSETVDINEDDENRMMVDIEGDSNSQAMRAGASVTQVRKKSKKKVRLQVDHRARKQHIPIGLTCIEGRERRIESCSWCPPYCAQSFIIKWKAQGVTRGVSVAST